MKLSAIIASLLAAAALAAPLDNKRQIVRFIQTGQNLAFHSHIDEH